MLILGSINFAVVVESLRVEDMTVSVLPVVQVSQVVTRVPFGVPVKMPLNGPW